MNIKQIKKQQWAWSLYDWANSVYNLVITSTIFPIYYAAITQPEEGEKIYPLGMEPDAVYGYSLTVSFFVVILLSPLLSAMADNRGKKRQYLNYFCTLGSLACIGLFFFDGAGNVLLGLICSVLASIGFWGSIVFYNAYLPELAKPEEQDALSARGFMMGYLGSVLLLVICLVLIQQVAPADQVGLYTRICFLITGVWWWLFAQLSLSYLPDTPPKIQPQKQSIFEGYKTLKGTFLELYQDKTLKTYLTSFFFYSVGIQTIFLMATLFGKNEIGLPTSKLIITILLLQIEAILGAYLFALLSKKVGNKITLIVMVCIWAGVSLAAFMFKKDMPSVEYYFYALAGVVGLVMGGIQSLSRSTYSKLLPNTDQHATYFSFYDVLEKAAIVLGTSIFAWLIDWTGNMRYSALAMAIFFGISLIFLFRLNAKAVN